MSSVGPPLHGFPNLFCQYSDELLGHEADVLEHWLGWERTPHWQSLKAQMADDVLSGRMPPSIEMRVNNGAARAFRLYAALRGMDEAFRFVNPKTKGPDRTPATLVALEDYVAEHRRLTTDDTPGALIPRLVRCDAMGADVDHIRDLFTHVQPVPPESWDKADIVPIAPPGGIAAHDLRAGLDIACVPVIADPAELVIEPRVTPTRRRYRIGPRDEPATRARIAEIVAALDRSGAQLAVAPEATLTQVLLADWQRELRARRASRLRYVLAGTGNFRGPRRVAGNTAILLDGRSGDLVGRQEKLFPFNMTADTLDRWQLAPYLGVDSIAEDLAVAERRLTVFELGAVRLAVLVCEDVNRPGDLGRLIADLGITHLLVPVFSRPLDEHRWEHNAAKIHVRDTGTAVIVANSLAMASILAVSSANTSLVVAGDGRPALLGQSRGPAYLARFRLLPDGSAKRL